MKKILSFSKHLYLRRVGLFLIAAVLIAGVVSCTPGETYNLTMAVNPAGGGTATDETGGSPYAEGTDVDIKAVAADCYRFVDWSAPAGTFGNATAAETTFTMPARDVTVTANFELTPPDHFKFYDVDYETAPEVGVDVQLVDQFGNFTATVGYAMSFGNPVEKLHNDVVTPIADLNRHYTIYELESEEEPQSWKVMINNQFQDDMELTVQGPVALAVPTEKLEAGLEAPVCLDHLLVYEVIETEFPEVGVHLTDQFIEEDVTVWEPAYFANPVQKTIIDTSEVTDVKNPDDHWVFYWIEDIEYESIEKTIQIANQFGDEQTLDLTYRDTLAVPSQKISWEQPLDHFKGYWATWADEPPMYGENVWLEDQFVTINATVYDPFLFANPVGKGHGEVWTPISNWNNHLTMYWIDYEGVPMTWEVTVNNQFGNGQVLYVYGPFWVAVPTKKGLHDPPVGLDHFLVYQVVDVMGMPVEAEVWLEDQFMGGWTVLDEPCLFAIPAQKTHGDVLTPIKNSDEHLLFYYIAGGDFMIPELQVGNQFGPQLLHVAEEEYDVLGVPSEKIDWDGPWSDL
jgi:hypothetical protein